MQVDRFMVEGFSHELRVSIGKHVNDIWTTEIGSFLFLSKTRPLNFRAPNLRQRTTCAWLVGGWQDLDRDETKTCPRTLKDTASSVEPCNEEDNTL